MLIVVGGGQHGRPGPRLGRCWQLKRSDSQQSTGRGEANGHQCPKDHAGPLKYRHDADNIARGFGCTVQSHVLTVVTMSVLVQES